MPESLECLKIVWTDCWLNLAKVCSTRALYQFALQLHYTYISAFYYFTKTDQLEFYYYWYFKSYFMIFCLGVGRVVQTKTNIKKITLKLQLLTSTINQPTIFFNDKMSSLLSFFLLIDKGVSLLDSSVNASVLNQKRK